MPLATTLHSACALNQVAQLEVDEALARYERRRSADAASYAPPISSSRSSGPSSGSRSSAAGTDPAVSQSGSNAPTTTSSSALSSLIEIALERNPDIVAAAENARALAARIPRETALPDPALMTRTMPRPQMFADGSNYFILGVEQDLPWPGKLDRQGRIALEEARIALARLAQTRQRIIAEIKRAFADLHVIHRTTRINEENLALLADLIEVARGQLAAAQRPQQDVLRAELEHANLEVELLSLRQRKTTTLAMLNSLLSRPVDTEITARLDESTNPAAAHLQHLLAMASEKNPRLAALQGQIHRDEQSLALARLAYLPDFVIGFDWMLMEPRRALRPPIDPATGMRPAFNRMSEEGGDMYAIVAGFSLPIWYEKIEAGIRESKARLSASRQELSAARNNIDYQVQDALARTLAQRDIANRFDSFILPQAKQAYDVSRISYTAGASDFQYLIDNWQRWLFFRVQRHRAIGELQRAIADLEEALGLSLVEASADPSIAPGDSDPTNGEP